MKDCMLEAKTIRPTTYKNKVIKCADCGIKYSKKHYNILYKAQKIVYFNFFDEELCHDCFYNVCDILMEKEGINNLKIYLLDGRKKVILNIDKEKK